MAGTLVLDTLQNGAGTASTSADNVINGCAKAWVNFNGTSTVAIRASYNVSSITDNGTGNYTVNFTNAFADANYSAVVTNGYVSYSNVPVTSDFATTSVKIRCYNANDVIEDTSVVSVAIFR